MLMILSLIPIGPTKDSLLKEKLFIIMKLLKILERPSKNIARELERNLLQELMILNR